MIRERHGLAGLRIGYRQVAKGRPELTCLLQSPGEQPGNWDVPIGADTPLDDPHLTGRVRDLMGGHQVIAGLRDDGAALWLNLTGEHPLLAAVDWESRLVELGVPVLRLPAHLTVPEPAPRRARIVIWTSAAEPVGAVLDSVRGVAGDAPDIHVFADADLVRECTGRFADRATVHDTAVSIGGSWPDWVVQGLDGRSVDVLHLIGSGFQSGDQGAYLAAADPRRGIAGAGPGAVGPQQLSALMTTTGAWAMICTSVTSDRGLDGLRLLATRINETRAAAAIVHDPATARPDALSDVYRLLLHHPTTMPAPSAGLVITAHPARFGIPEVAPAYRPKRSELDEYVASGAADDRSVVAQRQIREMEAQLSFESDAPLVASARDGLELAKSRFDAILRDSKPRQEPS